MFQRQSEGSSGLEYKATYNWLEKHLKCFCRALSAVQARLCVNIVTMYLLSNGHNVWDLKITE